MWQNVLWELKKNVNKKCVFDYVHAVVRGNASYLSATLHFPEKLNYWRFWCLRAVLCNLSETVLHIPSFRYKNKYSREHHSRPTDVRSVMVVQGKLAEWDGAGALHRCCHSGSAGTGCAWWRLRAALPVWTCPPLRGRCWGAWRTLCPCSAPPSVGRSPAATHTQTHTHETWKHGWQTDSGEDTGIIPVKATDWIPDVCLSSGRTPPPDKLLTLSTTNLSHVTFQLHVTVK